MIAAAREGSRVAMSIALYPSDANSSFMRLVIMNWTLATFWAVAQTHTTRSKVRVALARGIIASTQNFKRTLKTRVCFTRWAWGAALAANLVSNSCSASSLLGIHCEGADEPRDGMPFFYAVRGGPTPGVYASWDEACKHGAQGVHGVQQKKFASRAEADAFVRNSPMPAAAPVPASAQVPRPRPAQAAAAASSSSAATSSRGAAGIVAGELACFTDGACKGNNHVALNVCPAGWGVAVVEGAEGDGASGAGRLIVELFGPVGLDPASPHFLGAEVGSNNTGELSAVCEALHWLAHVERSGRSAVICYDSEYAANQTLGQQKTNKNKALVARAQALLASARARRAVRFLHVKGTMTP